LKALLALSMTAVPSVGMLAGVKANATQNPLLNATATTQNSALQRVQANTRTITGVVKDAQGEPLIGVSVQVKGTGKGAITNIDGQYTLTTNESNPTLVFAGMNMGVIALGALVGAGVFKEKLSMVGKTGFGRGISPKPIFHNTLIPTVSTKTYTDNSRELPYSRRCAQYLGGEQ